MSDPAFPPTTCNPPARHTHRHHGDGREQIVGGDDNEKEDCYSNDDCRPHRSQSRHGHFGDDKKRYPGNDGAIDHADDCLAECFDITTRGKEAARCDEPNPDQSEAAPRGPSAIKAQMPPSTATLTDNASNSVMAFPKNSLLRDAALT